MSQFLVTKKRLIKNEHCTILKTKQKAWGFNLFRANANILLLRSSAADALLLVSYAFSPRFHVECWF